MKRLLAVITAILTIAWLADRYRSSERMEAGE